jgi:hypothetical protein
MMSFLAHWLGLDDPSGPVYAWWSGFFGDVTILAIPVVMLRKHNCETHGCARIGRHDWIDPATGQTHKLCRKHHPLGHLTAQGIAESEAAT